MIRRSCLRCGHATSNMIAPSYSGRWFNPPHQWTISDVCAISYMFFGPPMMMAIMVYAFAYAPTFSLYQDQHYYPTQPYTKEFIEKYKRMERWRWYE